MGAFFFAMTTPIYCNSQDIKDAMPDGNWGTGYDVLLQKLAERASRVIDTWTGRKPGAYQTTEDSTRYYDGADKSQSSGRQHSDETLGGLYLPSSQLWVDELAEAPTSVAMSLDGSLNYTPLASTDYICWPYNALDEGIPFSRLDLDVINGNYPVWYAFRRGIKIIGKFGYSTSCPEDIVQATIIQASRWFKRGQQGFQDTAAIPELGQLRYVKQLDPDVEMMLMHYRRVTI